MQQCPLLSSVGLSLCLSLSLSLSPLQMPLGIAMAGFLPGVSELVFLSSSSQKRDCVGCCHAPQHDEDVQVCNTMDCTHMLTGAISTQRRSATSPPILRASAGCINSGRLRGKSSSKVQLTSQTTALQRPRLACLQMLVTITRIWLRQWTRLQGWRFATV
jgi:hypothetical protein